MQCKYNNVKKQQSEYPHKFILKLSDRLDLEGLNKHVARQNSPIYYTRKNVRQQYKNDNSSNVK